MAAPTHFEVLSTKIADRTVIVGIVGLGYVGLPLALTFAEAGVSVLGFDVDKNKVASLLAGDSYFEHFPASRIAPAVKSQKLSATGDFSRLGEVDVIIIAVPTPLTAHREPDMSFIEATAESIAQTLRPGQLIVLESTTYPGTTDGFLRGHLETDKCRLMSTFFSPSRQNAKTQETRISTPRPFRKL